MDISDSTLKELESDLRELEEKCKKAQDFFMKKWQPLRKETIAKLEEIADWIQGEENKYRIGSIVYSSGGIIGGGLIIGGIIAIPFTFGASLGLSIAGISTSLASGAARFTHGVVNTKKISGKCKEAVEICQRDNEMTEKLSEYIVDVDHSVDRILSNERKKKFVEYASNAGSIGTLARTVTDLVFNCTALHLLKATGNMKIALGALKLPEVFQSVAPAFARDTIAGVTKLSSKVAIPLAAVGILIEIGMLTYNARKISKKEVCSQALKLRNAIRDLQTQEEVLHNQLFDQDYK